jgi:hypothetical protein
VTVSENENIGVGETDELSLRVSAAALARVVFSRPEDGTRMLALEHKAYVSRTGQPPPTVVKAQPFGGAVRIVHRDRFAEVVGGFSFDSERSREEQDFRIFIRPSHLAKLRDYASQIAGQPSVSDLEIGPSRELEEEFEDTLGINLDPDAYTVHPVGIVWQSHASPTSNLRALGKPTARIYWIYEVEIEDAELCQKMLDNSRTHPGRVMAALAEDRHRAGEPGRANAVLVVPQDAIRQAYLARNPSDRGEPLPFQGTVLSGNVAAVLDGLSVSKYERLGRQAR